MGLMNGGGPSPGYDPVALEKARKEAALAADVEGDPAQWLIGMTPEVAEVTLKAKGFRFRIWSRQGVQDFMTTADHVVTRYNVNLDADGKIDEVLGRG